MSLAIVLEQELGRFDGYGAATGLQEKLQSIILSAQSKRKKPARLPTESDWRKLARILGGYLQGRSDYAGYLTLAQCKDLQNLATQSGKLLERLSGLEASDVGWYLTHEFAEHGIARKDRERFEKVLAVLSKLDPRTPRKPRKKSGTGRDRQGSGMFDAELRADLQSGLDRWWVACTGLPKDVDETVENAYGEFLKEIFGPIRLANKPGWSSTAVQAARKSAKDKNLAYMARGELIRDMLARIAPKSTPPEE